MTTRSSYILLILLGGWVFSPFCAPQAVAQIPADTLSCVMPFELPSDKALLGEVHYSPLIGGTIGGGKGQTFSADVLGERARLVEIAVNTEPEAPHLIQAIRLGIEQADQGRTSVVCGEPQGEWSAPFNVPEGQRIIGLSGAVGWYVDALRFHFDGGGATPTYGGAGGDNDFQLFLKARPDGFKGEMRGLWGTYADGYIESIGLIYWPEE